jgi:hypothetical protein
MGTDMNADNPSTALGKEQARVLAEALPYLHAYHGKTFVIDYARRSAGRPAAWNSLGRDLALLSLTGGGPGGWQRASGPCPAFGRQPVHVVDARRPDVLLLEILTSESRGTLILPDGIAGVIEQSAQYLAPWNKGDERESC